MTEFEQTFSTAIRLLHSKSKNSVDQLKLMLDDVLKVNKQDKKSLVIENIKKELQTNKIPEKRPFEKVSKDFELETKKARQSPEVSSTKKPFQGGSTSQLNTSLTSIKNDLNALSGLDQPSYSNGSSSNNNNNNNSNNNGGNTIKIEDDSEATDIEDESTEQNSDFNISMMDLLCVVCKSLTITKGNQLIECQDCHSLYHQECHKPTVTDHDVNDPRLVWYCAKCTKQSIKKITTTTKSGNGNNKVNTVSSSPTTSKIIPSVKTKESGTSNSNNNNTSSTININSSNIINTNSNIQPFKREMKIVSSSSSPSISSTTLTSVPVSPSKPTGLAGLAANFHRSNSVSSSSMTSKSNNGGTSISSPSSSTTPTSSSPSSIASADKRLQMMKKKVLEKKKK